MSEQKTIEKTVIGKRVVAIAWVPVLDVDGLFIDGLFTLGSIVLEGGATLEFQGCDGDAAFVELTETDHADVD